MELEKRLLNVEGQVAALELICPMIVAHVVPKQANVRTELIALLESLAAGYDFPVDSHPSFVEGFTNCFDQVATKIRQSP